MKLLTSCFVCLFATGCIGLGPKYSHPKVKVCSDIQKLEKPIWGISDYGSYEIEFKRAKKLNAKWMRVNLPWNRLAKTIEKNNLTINFVKAHPELVDEYIKKHNWKFFDQKLLWAKNHGIELIALVGHGYRFSLPKMNGKTIGPDTLGKENYLGNIYLHVRAIARKYSGEVKVFQVENELNVARLTQLWGWRTPVGIEGLRKGPWGDVKFLTKLIETLSGAIKVEIPDALVTHNFMTDVHKKIQHFVGQPSWKEAVELWRHSLDFIGLDTYPNYYSSKLVLDNEIELLIKGARKHSCGKSVVLLETNYPHGPTKRGYGFEQQKQYIQHVTRSVEKASGDGVLFYGAVSPLHFKKPVQTFNKKDLRSIKKLGKYYKKGRIWSLLTWALFNRKYATGQFLNVLQSVEGHWPLVHESDELNPAGQAYSNFLNQNH